MLEVYYIDKTLKKGNIKDLEKIKSKNIWIDVTKITKEEAETLSELYDLHPLTVDDLYKSYTRIKVEEFNEYLFCVFYGVIKSSAVEMIELDFVLGKNFLITSRHRDLKSYNELKKNTEKIESLLKRGPDFLFQKLLDGEIDNYFPVLQEIEEQIEVLEEDITRKPRPEYMSNILKLKRKVVQIKKHALPQREKISFLAKNEYSFISKKAIPYFRDIYDHSIKVSDSIEYAREAIGITFEIYMSSISHNTNEVMKVLSIIATIALPLTVVSSIYGTNFDVLPGSAYPYGFWVMIGLMSFMSAGLIHFFRMRKWF